MSGLKFATGEWIVVCDGAKALLLRNKGDEKFPNLETVSVRQQDNPQTGAQGADKPGRVHPPAGTARSAVEQTDWHDRAEQEFLTALASDLNASAHKGEISGLTIVAAPRALGMLRPHYSPALNAVLRHEIAKDYATHPVHEIEKLLTG